MTTFKDNLYKFLSDYLVQFDTSPSFAEMTQAMGISPRSKSLISKTLRMLEKEGRVVLTKNGRRLLISLRNEHMPLLGRISAGNPIEVISDNQFIDVNALFAGLDRFALRVAGSSMIDEGIRDGDMIICRKADSAKEGDIVVALIDQYNTTLKRISYKVKGMITLVPANAELKPRAYLPERISIQGIYIGLVRTHG